MTLRLTNAVLAPYNWTRYLLYKYFSAAEKEALVKQVEELKSQLQWEKEYRALQEERADLFSIKLQSERERSAAQEKEVNELSTNLKSETDENKSLWDQVEFLTNELHKERHGLTYWKNMCQKERAMGLEQYTLGITLQKKLDQQMRQVELMEQKGRKTQQELDRMHVAFDRLQRAYYEMSQTHEEILQRHNQDFKEHETKILQEASEREKSLRMELEELEFQLHEQTSRNFELVAKFKAEEKASQVLQAETVQLMEELVDQVCQQDEEESSAVSLEPELPELVEEECPAVLQDPELPKLVEEGCPAVFQDPGLVAEGYSSISLDPEHVEEKSSAVSQDPELVEESSTSLQDLGLVEEECPDFSQDPELLKSVEEECPAVLQDPGLMEQRCPAISQDPELVEGRSTAVSEKPDLVEKTEVCEENAVEVRKKHSVWKRFRHFLGLRKKRGTGNRIPHPTEAPEWTF